MKILIPSMGFGRSGGARVLSQFANYWIKQGHEVSFLVPIGNDQPYFPTTATIIIFDRSGKICNKTRTEVAINNPSSAANGAVSLKSKIFRILPFGFLVGQRRLYTALNNLKDSFDIIMANHSLTAFPTVYSKQNSAKFYYIQAYEPEFYAARRTLSDKLAGWYVAKTYQIAKLEKIVNAPIYYHYKNLSAIKFVPCGLDLELYVPKEAGLIDFSKDIIKLGAIGRIEAHKGTSYVLEAYKKLINNIATTKKFELYLAFGDHKVEQLNGVKVVTPKNDAELAAFYREMDIVIAPGTIQFGAVHYPVLEAMASGTPIITTFYLPAHDANAWLVEPGNSDSIVEQVLSMLSKNDLAREKAENGLRDIRQFDWNVVSGKMLKLFQASLDAK